MKKVLVTSPNPQWFCSCLFMMVQSYEEIQPAMWYILQDYQLYHPIEIRRQAILSLATKEYN